jgi:sulfite exporter TauE/SafE
VQRDGVRVSSVSWPFVAALFSLSATLAGVVSGGLLGLAGSVVSLELRSALATVLALAMIAVALAELAGRHRAPIQCNRETPQQWVSRGPIRWALWNGLALGNGAFNRIGFWLWYAIPFSAFLAGSPWLGAAIYGLYGAARGLSVWPMMLLLGPRRGEDWNLWLLGQREAALVATSGLLLVLGLVAVIVVGL